MCFRPRLPTPKTKQLCKTFVILLRPPMFPLATSLHNFWLNMSMTSDPIRTSPESSFSPEASTPLWFSSRSFRVSGNSLMAPRACVCQLAPRGFTLRWSLKPPDSLRRQPAHNFPDRAVAPTCAHRHAQALACCAPPQLFCLLQPTVCTFLQPLSFARGPRLACLAQLRSISGLKRTLVAGLVRVHVPTHMHARLQA